MKNSGFNLFASLLIGLAAAPLADAAIYWDTNGNAAGVGGTGTFSSSQLVWNPLADGTGTTTSVSSPVADNLIFEGTAGTVSMGGSFTATSFAFNTTGYTLTTTNANRTLTGPVTLASNVILNVSSFSSNTLTFSGGLTAGTNSGLSFASSTGTRQINFNSGTFATPVAIVGTATPDAMILGNSSGTGIISGLITNNGTVPLTLAPASGTALQIAGGITGSQGVTFAVNGTSTGRVELNSASTYTGETRFNGTIGLGSNTGSIGAVRLMVDNGISTLSSGVVMGYTTGLGENLDMAGKNQTMASLTSNPGGTGSIFNSTTTTTSTLTIDGAATSGSFNLPITNGSSSSRQVALTRAGSGTTTLGGLCSYTGATTVTSGTLNLSATGGLSGTAVSVSPAGTFAQAAGGTISGASSLSMGTQAVASTGSTTLSGTNTYTGITKISNGTLVVNGPAALSSSSVLNSSGSSNDASTLNLATADGGYVMSAVSIGGIMKFTGPVSGSSTVTFTGSAAQGFTGSSATKKIQIDSGAGVVVNNASTFPFELLGSSATADRSHSFQVDGSLTFNAAVVATAPIAFPAITGGFVKTGTGVLTLNASNTYNGQTVVGGGLLRLGGSTALPGGIGATGGSSALVFDGGIVALTAASGDFTRPMTTDTAGVTSAIPATSVGWVSGSTGGFAAFGGDRSVNFGGAGASVSWSSGNGKLGSGLVLGHGTSDSTITLVNGIAIGNSVARTIIVNDGSQAVDAILSGVVSGSLGATFVKDGAGTLALNAVNTYLSDTQVLAGVLAVNGTSIADTNKVVLNGGKIDLTGTETVGSLYFAAVQQASGTWGASGSGATNIDNTRFSGTGVLNVVPVVLDPYTTWIDTPAYNSPPLSTGDKLPTADPDNDGINNLLEFTLGGNPVVSSQSIQPTQATVGANLVLSYKRSDESESPATTQVGQWSADLGTWTDVTPVLVNENGAAADDMTISVPTSNAVAGHLFVRLKVVK